MRRRTKSSLGTILALSLLALVTGSCGLTNRLWEWAATEPVAAEGAVVREDDVLEVLLRYEDGSRRRLRADLGPAGLDYPEPRSVSLEPEPEPALSPGLAVDCGNGFLIPEEDPPVRARLGYVAYRNKRGATDHTLWLETPARRAVVTVPGRYDVGDGRPLLAVVLTPVTAAIDIVTAPVWVAWIVFTAGGHGPCWLPWYD